MREKTEVTRAYSLTAPFHLLLPSTADPCECGEFAPIIQCLAAASAKCRILTRRVLARRKRALRENAGAVREPELPRGVGLLHRQGLRDGPRPPVQRHTQ